MALTGLSLAWVWGGPVDGMPPVYQNELSVLDCMLLALLPSDMGLCAWRWHSCHITQFDLNDNTYFLRQSLIGSRLCMTIARGAPAASGHQVPATARSLDNIPTTWGAIK